MVSSKNLLFQNISESEQQSMMNCFQSHLKDYSSGEIICFYSEKDKGIGIVESGEACVVHCLPNGSRTILENLNVGDIFGQLFYFHAAKDNITVEATTQCTIRYIDYEHIIKRCSKACAHHSQLVSNILLMIQNKTQKTCEHLEVLSQRTIRDRIYTFFEILSTKTNSRQFEIPFTMSNMADYLSVDRSAMSRELSKMKDEGIIKINKRKVTLL
jgi:CRP-like cAMP-binding protein